MQIPVWKLIRFRSAGIIGLVAAALFSSLSCSPQMPWLAGQTKVAWEDSLSGDARSIRNVEVFDMAWALVYKRYYDPKLKAIDWQGLRAEYRMQADTASTETSLYGILSEMTASLQDGHTRVQAPKAVTQNENNVDVGIGLRGEWLEDQFVVTEVSPNSPASKAGIETGWVLTSWGSIPFNKIKHRGARYAVKEGQTVKLSFLGPQDEVHRVQLVGEMYPTTKPKVARLLDDHTLYLRFDQFNRNTASWFGKVLQQQDDITAVVVDLRNNRGGQLSALKQTLSQFYGQPRVVGEEIQRNGKVRPLRIDGVGRKEFEGTVAVLVDRYSQSAAEVFAAAIQETGRGVVVGRQTAGNVLISHREALPDGGELRISTHDYVTVGGSRLEGEGVKPDVPIQLELEDLRQGIDRDIEMALGLIDVLNERQDQDQLAEGSRR